MLINVITVTLVLIVFLFDIRQKLFDFDALLQQLIPLIGVIIYLPAIAYMGEKLYAFKNVSSNEHLINNLNNQQFNYQLANYIEEAQKKSEGLALMVLDPDYFSKYNERHGYLQGDMAINQLGALLKSLVGNKNYVFRYNKIRFAVILPGISREKALITAERIREEINNFPFLLKYTQPQGRLTVTIGLALYPEVSQDKDELIKKAEEAMIYGKFKSKNAVHLYVSILENLKNELNGRYNLLYDRIDTLAKLINARDPYTFGHCERVANYTRMIGMSIGLPDDRLMILQLAAMVHDIGKTLIPQSILDKTGKLTSSEVKLLRDHVLSGITLLEPAELLSPIIPVVRQHHERWDGKGYPDGLKEEEILLEARILALADSYDAMRSNRPYKDAMGVEEALSEIQACGGTQFDPLLASNFITIVSKVTDK